MNFRELLSLDKISLTDGAWGTELTRRGLEFAECPELANVDNPEIVKSVAKSYVDAGAIIIETNSFGGSPLKLGMADLDERTEELNIAAARLSHEAADGAAFVMASVGPTGQFMEPLGMVTEAEMVKQFSVQIKALAEGGADAIILETMSDIGEASAALKAAREVCDLPVCVSMTFDKTPKGYATMMGGFPEVVAETFTKLGADFIGSNCGNGMDAMSEITGLLRGATDLPILVRANAGLPELVGEETIFRETPEVMVTFIEKLIDSGASFIGGCCGTTPAHIKRFAEELTRLAPDRYVASIK